MADATIDFSREAELAALRSEELAAVRLLKIRAARENLLDFIELMMPDPEFSEDASKTSYTAKPHHKLMIGAVEQVEQRKMMRSAYSLPPQHGKTTILSLMGMAWIIGRRPRWDIIVGTYSEDRAQKVGSELRDILQSAAFRQVFPKCVMKKGSKAKDDMEFVLGGSITLRGRGNGTTGYSCDLFVIDDPIKDHVEAASAAVLQQCKDWYSSVAFSRVRATTPIMIVHTRWNEDDLIGWLCDPEHPENIAKPDRCAKWKYLNIPAIVDDPELAELLGIEPGARCGPRSSRWSFWTRPTTTTPGSSPPCTWGGRARPMATSSRPRISSPIRPTTGRLSGACGSTPPATTRWV